LGITHLTTHETMNFVMYTFEGVARTTAIISRVVAECGPRVNTGQKIVSLRGDVVLELLKVTLNEMSE
jgi:hypothetical protein